MATPNWIFSVSVLFLAAQPTFSTLIIRDPCANYQCFNRGVCTAPADAPYCLCPPGFTGRRCELSVVTQKPGQCPAIGSSKYSCRDPVCRSDYDCSGLQKCCRNECGYNSCTNPLSPPAINITNPCATIKCTATTECRVVFKCQQCEPTVQCVQRSLINPNLDGRCRRQGFRDVLLVDGPTPTSDYTALRCRGRYNSCPSGSACLRGLTGDDICCRGPRCIFESPYCPPGRACIQAVIERCLPEDCWDCREDEECVPSRYSNRYRCVRKQNPCPRGCRDNEECQYTGNTCDDGLRPGRDCRDLYECRPVNPCGTCPRGQVCIDTGIRCIRAPCPSFQCVPNNECGGCRPGQICREVRGCKGPGPCPPVFECTEQLDRQIELVIKTGDS
ncbi:neurogenic locus notch protein 1-like isoform X2 [Biomphalaria pfeifferi]|uniref:Neurogenic locus notch protein 1-like isoform X2 n=1 Tax=Biomphalaria pfeifferi TaxID=112525 RepID=A0AAD8AZ89_BIOPF|nr:neurogenic locus notch protein 1-like isoform X2 [Biomphalaria pfeifferi]